jgi:hypothetical protein
MSCIVRGYFPALQQFCSAPDGGGRPADHHQETTTTASSQTSQHHDHVLASRFVSVISSALQSQSMVLIKRYVVLKHVKYVCFSQ